MRTDKILRLRLSRVLRPTRHIIGHFGDNLPSQSLDWCKTALQANYSAGTSKTKYNNNQAQTQKYNYYRKLLIQTKPNLTKLKPGLGDFYAIRPVNGLDLFYSSGDPHGAIKY